jgi:hypothetical protein
LKREAGFFLRDVGRIWFETMKELISPAQSEIVVAFAALVVTIALAVYGWRKAKLSGVWLAALGPALYAAWRCHVYVTRYDPQTGYFGLDKVSVLVVEAVLAVALGTAVGKVWSSRLKGPDETGELKSQSD